MSVKLIFKRSLFFIFFWAAPHPEEREALSRMGSGYSGVPYSSRIFAARYPRPIPAQALTIPAAIVCDSLKEIDGIGKPLQTVLAAVTIYVVGMGIKCVYFLSIDRRPAPMKANTANPPRNKSACSLSAKGSLPCTISAATSMVNIKGMAHNRVFQPKTKPTAQNNSANTVKIKLGAAPIPKGSAKPQSEFMIFMNLGQP